MDDLGSRLPQQGRDAQVGDAELRRRYERLADEALAHNEIATDEELGIIAVPDVVRVDMLANGAPSLPTTWTVERHDGRRVYFFRMPGELP